MDIFPRKRKKEKEPDELEAPLTLDEAQELLRACNTQKELLGDEMTHLVDLKHAGLIEDKIYSPKAEGLTFLESNLNAEIQRLLTVIDGLQASSARQKLEE